MFCLKQPQLIHESLCNNLQYVPIHATLILYHDMGQMCADICFFQMTLKQS